MPHDSAPKITNDHPSTELRSFGRRRGRTFGARRAKLYDTVLPTVQVDLSAAPATCLNPAQPHWLEIGFGGAEHLLWQARSNPDVRIIGCEPFRDGVAKALAGIEAFDLLNLRLHPDVRLEGEGGAVAGPDLRHHGFGARLIALIVDADFPALARGLQRDRRANAAAATGDQKNAAHVPLAFSSKLAGAGEITLMLAPRG
jgi:hypothetical protein